MTAGTAQTTILHVTTEMHMRGGERQLLWLHQGLRDSGMKSFIAAPARSALCHSNDANICRLPFSRWRGLPNVPSLVALCRRIRPDVLHCHDSRGMTAGIVASLIFRIPCVVTRRVVYPVRPTVFNRWRYGHCRTVIAVSHAVKNQCALVARSENIRVVHDGVEWTCPLTARSNAREELGVPATARLVGSVGYFTREKNLPLLCALGHRLQGSFPDVSIAAIGPVPAAARTLLDIPPNVLLPGMKPDAQQLYGAFDLYVSTATQEGLGSALLDAMVRDIPVVAIDSGGSQDLFPPDGTMPVAQGNDEEFFRAVEKILTDPASAACEAKKRGEWARERFSRDAMVAGTAAVYVNFKKGIVL